jgi:hypothetical protein
MEHYILDEKGQPKKVDFKTWAYEFERTNRKVKVDELPGGVTVSTVFLGLNHNFSRNPKAAPILWETMVFGGPWDGEMMRYYSKADALKGHDTMVRLVMTEVKP